MGLVKSARMKRGLTIREISKMIGMHSSHFCEMESGIRNLPRDETVLAELCLVLDLDLNSLKREQTEFKIRRTIESIRKKDGDEVFLTSLRNVLKSYEGVMYEY